MANGRKPKRFEFVSVDANDARNKTLNDVDLLRVRRKAMKSHYDRQEEAREEGEHTSDDKASSGRNPSISSASSTEDIGNAKQPEDPKLALAKIRHQEKIWKRAASSPSPLSIMKPQGFEGMRNDFGVDISHLSAFGELEIGLFAFPTLQKDPARIRTLLSSSRPESFLALLPARYGHDPTLDSAMHCVAARMSQVFATSTSDEFVLNMYIKALRNLQPALASSKGRTDTNVLAACQLLSIFELLNASDEQNWAKHKEGTVRLVEFRGPDQFKSDFDKALLRSQAMTIVIEKTLQRQPCFFAKSEWQAYFSTIAAGESTLDEWAYWTLFAPVSQIPNLFHDVTNYSKSRSSPVEARQLYARAKDLRQSLLNWLAIYNEKKASGVYSESSSGPTKYASLPVRAAMTEAQLPQNMRSTFVHAIMGINLMIRVFTQDFQEREALENEAQRFTDEAIDSERLAKELYPTMDPIMQWHVEQKVQVAHAFRELKYSWSEDIELDRLRISSSPDTASPDTLPNRPNT